MGDPLVDGDRAALEWWTVMKEDDDDITVPGCLLLDFEGDRCARLNEYWHEEKRAVQPYDGWGLLTQGNTESTRAGAARWASAWKAGWEALDPGPIVAAYETDAVHRSAPLREPGSRRGRPGTSTVACPTKVTSSPASASGRLRALKLSRSTWRRSMTIQWVVRRRSRAATCCASRTEGSALSNVITGMQRRAGCPTVRHGHVEPTVPELGYLSGGPVAAPPRRGRGGRSDFRVPGPRRRMASLGTPRPSCEGGKKSGSSPSPRPQFLP